jgi:ATPase involved in DNA replication initiation
MQTLEQIAERVYLATNFDLTALRTRGRDEFRVAARQLFCYYARLEKYKFKEIGKFVHIDHASAIHGYKRVEGMKDTDALFKGYIYKYEIMSKRKQIIELIAPDYENGVENDTFNGFSCPACNGRGWHLDFVPGGSTPVDCPRCGGSGKLRVRVTMEWEADTK